MPIVQLVFVVLVLTLCLSNTAQAEKSSYQFLSADKVAPLKRGQGYLLMHLEVSGPSPFFKIAKIRSNKKLTSSSAKRSAIQISLKGKPKGFYLLPLSQGLYQITEVYSPYFNLPHRMETYERPAWRFRIEEQRTNYAGKLFISSERSVNYVDIKLLNRIAADSDAIERELSGLLRLAPLSLGIPFRDDFFQQLSISAGG